MRDIGKADSKKREILRRVIHSTVWSTHIGTSSNHQNLPETDEKDAVKDRIESRQCLYNDIIKINIHYHWHSANTFTDSRTRKAI